MGGGFRAADPRVSVPVPTIITPSVTARRALAKSKERT